MSSNRPWPEKGNAIVSITYELIVGFDEEGHRIFRRGHAQDSRELESMQALLEPLQPHTAEITSQTMGKVDIKLEDGSLITIRPVFHRPYGVYKDLFKVYNFDCVMPQPLADILNRWRNRLLN